MLDFLIKTNITTMRPLKNMMCSVKGLALGLSAVFLISACSDGDASSEATAGSCKLKSYTTDYDKSRMCIYTCANGELEGRTRSAAQGACLPTIPGR